MSNTAHEPTCFTHATLLAANTAHSQHPLRPTFCTTTTAYNQHCLRSHLARPTLLHPKLLTTKTACSQHCLQPALLASNTAYSQSCSQPTPPVTKPVTNSAQDQHCLRPALHTATRLKLIGLVARLQPDNNSLPHTLHPRSQNNHPARTDTHTSSQVLS